MDMTELKRNVMEFIRKYRYVVLILMVGLLLMSLPEKKEEEPVQTETRAGTEESLQESLADILSLIQGAGKVKVLLTQAAGEQTLYQTDEHSTADSIRKDTVLVSNASREEMGLIRQINPPEYRGAIVLCQGADNASVRLSVVEAVKSVTGLTSDRITVLKMK